LHANANSQSRAFPIFTFADDLIATNAEQSVHARLESANTRNHQPVGLQTDIAVSGYDDF
jgi:hypothetical protein